MKMPYYSKWLILISVSLLAFTWPQKKKLRLFLAGDSTMSAYNADKTPQRGWGQELHRFFDPDVAIINKARGGRSTKSFVNEGLWQSLLDSLRKGDVVFIEFGHNDHDSRKPERFVTPDQYEANLKRMVGDVRSREGIPVLLTPIAMRTFDAAGHYRDSHGPYPEKVRAVSVEMKAPLIDLDRFFGEVINHLGPEKSKDLFMNFGAGIYDAYPDGNADNTHLREPGALTVAELAANTIRQKKIKPLYQYLKK